MIPLNHLSGQKSPYLLQHVDNPVDWYPWGQEAFRKAQGEQKPIFLSIGYSTCHWCHVMAHESFENENIAKIINQYFVAIKVDREERPDLDQIYMSATMAMTGQGGWPLTVFLTPEGKPFFGGTYFPPFPKWGTPGLIDLLKTIAQSWQDQREEILSSSEAITQALREQVAKFTTSSQLPATELLELAFRQISSQFDANNGGFGDSPKFPMGHQLSFLLRYHKRNEDKRSLEMLETTLMAIAYGGIYDHLGGGFHRYSTDAHWHVPHFEKMLYDQALLVRVYLEAYQLTGYLQYAIIARETLDYVLREMQHPQGGFYCAQDADSSLEGASHKSEGAFYVWTKEQIEELIGSDDAKIFNFAYGVESQGNAKNDPHGEFIGKNILFIAHTVSEVADHFGLKKQEVEQILNRSKQILFQTRNKREHPHLDDKVLTDWNGLMLGVFAFAGAVLNEKRFIEAAQKSADFILSDLMPEGRLLHRWCQGDAGILATLEDYAFLVCGLLDLYEVSFKEMYLIQAKNLAQEMIHLFEDKDKGGFFLTSKDAEELIIRPKDIYDGAIPSGNSVAAFSLMKLYLLTSEDHWLDCLERYFKSSSSFIEKVPSAYTFALCALDMYLGPSLKVVIEGLPDDSTLAQMKRVVYKHFIPNKSVLFRLAKASPIAYVCKGQVCNKPTCEISELEVQLLQI